MYVSPLHQTIRNPSFSGDTMVNDRAPSVDGVADVVAALVWFMP
jgi:hypothetical protein